MLKTIWHNIADLSIFYFMCLQTLVQIRVENYIHPSNLIADVKYLSFNFTMDVVIWIVSQIYGYVELTAN